MCLMLLLGILIFMLLRELRRKQRIPKSIWKGRGGDGGHVEVENLKTKMRLEKGELERKHLIWETKDKVKLQNVWF